MNHEEIKELIETIASTGVAEVEIETKELKLKVRSQPKVKQQKVEQVLVPQPQATVAAPQATPAVQSQLPLIPQTEAVQVGLKENTLIYIKSPMVGTFYQKPSPEKPNFLNVGDQVSPGQVVCVIEAMKLFNEIESEISGKVVQILVENSSPVEFDQPLFAIEP